jgi:hypothetical protein
MSKRPTTNVVVNIRELRVTNVVRDVLHVGDDTAVEVDKLTAKGVGGDVVNASARAPDRRQRRPRASKPAPRPILRAVSHAVVGVMSIGSMVTASGIAYALGWG